MRLRSWAEPRRVGRRALALAAVALAGCSATESGIESGERVTIHLSAPLRGPGGDAGRDVIRGARLALEEAGGRVGELEVGAEVHDGSERLPGGGLGWTPQKAAANARAATEDSSAIAYIGEIESGATRSSLPVTNEARLLQVSPASTATDLVQPFAGSDDVPEVQPSGERSFGRLVPGDSEVAAATRAWQRRLDGERAVRLDPWSGPSRLAARGARFAVSPALDPSQLPAPGQDFAREYRGRHGRPPGPYAAYGYEAMAVVLDAIRRAGDLGDDRDAVVEAFFATAGRESVLGAYSIDELGETTLGRLTGYRLGDGGILRPVALLRVR